MCALFMLVGLIITIRTGFFQFTNFKLWWRLTAVSLFKDKAVRKASDKKSLSQFQALSTALAATIGTGNIVGVATALVSGGAGAVFWMWVSALFGMMTKYAEIVLSMKYRYKNSSGEYVSGPMVVLKEGLHSKLLALLYAVFCLLACFGIGNMSQANSVAGALNFAFHIPNLITGIALAILCGLVILGGLRRIGRVAEKIVPITALLYVLGGCIIIAANIKTVPSAIVDIFKGAFGIRAAGGGVLGYTVAQAMRFGVARGVFSNEAGLGSSSMAHAAADTSLPARQAVWGIFEVFVDTIVVCTVTALAILTTGVSGSCDTSGSLIKGAALTILAFSKGLGSFAGTFVSCSIVFFAFASILGWSVYGQKCAEYLFGIRSIKAFRMIYIAASAIGCLLSVELVWSISDIFNGLMAIPNLIGVICLSGTVAVLTKKLTK